MRRLPDAPPSPGVVCFWLSCFWDSWAFLVQVLEDDGEITGSCVSLLNAPDVPPRPPLDVN